MIYHCISCVSRVKYNSYFYLINILFSENSNLTMKWKYYLKRGQVKYKYDYLKFKSSICQHEFSRMNPKSPFSEGSKIILRVLGEQHKTIFMLWLEQIENSMILCIINKRLKRVKIA